MNVGITMHTPPRMLEVVETLKAVKGEAYTERAVRASMTLKAVAQLAQLAMSLGRKTNSPIPALAAGNAVGCLDTFIAEYGGVAIDDLDALAKAMNSDMADIRAGRSEPENPNSSQGG